MRCRAASPHLALLASLLLGSFVAFGAGESAPRLFELRRLTPELAIVEWDTAALAAASARAKLEILDFPLGPERAVDLEVEPFHVTSARTRFVLGDVDGPDVPLDFDPMSIRFFRGRVRGYERSSVWLGIGEHLMTGHVDLGSTGGRYRLSSRGMDGEALAPRSSAVFAASAPIELPPDVPLCGVESDFEAVRPGDGAFEAGTVPVRGLKHLELAVDTDYEFFELFGNAQEAAAYLVALYAEVSAIYMRDAGVRIELVYARLWPDPDDLYNTGFVSPLNAFRIHWNEHMDHIPRDAAQHLSGRRSFPFGGQAYVGTLCGDFGYSVVGYAIGAFSTPTSPSLLNYDVSVTAHELGHNSGTLHTHDYDIDACDDPQSTPQRGTIMSYCGQTWSGGNANHDNYMHRLIRPRIEEHLAESACILDDCNQNGIADAVDAGGTSPDVNGNDVPDECEDCNANAILDSVEIGQGAADVDGNGVPDECQPDCNANGIPDGRDIALGQSADVYGNEIPDECEADCDRDGTSDYTEIQSDMTLDVDRDTVLDSCQDCDGDGTPDVAELAGAHHVWVASGTPGQPLRQFHPATGVLTAVSSGASVQGGHDVILSPGGGVWVSSAGNDRVLELTRAGVFTRTFVEAGAGGLDEPAGLALTPDGAKLLVASRGTHAVLAYDATSGTPLGSFVTPGSGGLVAPFGLTFGPSGNLYVTSATDEILEYDGETGAFVQELVSVAENGDLDDPRGLAFKPDGNLLVASFGSNMVIEYDGATGANLGKWAQVGTNDVLTQVSPWGIRVGPNGNVFVSRTGSLFGTGGQLATTSHHDHDDGHHDFATNIVSLHLSNAQIYEYDVRNGNFLRTYVGGNDHGLSFPTAFVFLDGFEQDCNRNQLQDSCDLANGAADVDEDGVLDVCEVDCNGNGRPDRMDVIPYGTLPDCNANLVPDSCDVAAQPSIDCTGNGIPDSCEVDCNLNGVADSCDVASQTSRDCNQNGVPDECDVFDDLEADQIGWAAGQLGDDALAGRWTAANPIGTSAAPEYDHTPGGGRIAFVTGQGAIGGSAAAADIDAGKTTLLSPVLDLSGTSQPELGYWRWFANHIGFDAGQEQLVVSITNDGGQSWIDVETIGPGGPETLPGWRFHQFRVGDFVAPTSNVRLRFVASDLGSDSVVEAAIDDLVVLPTCCEELAAVTVAVEHSGPGTTEVVWPAQPGATFDVAGGSIGSLNAGAGIGDAVCLASDLASSAWIDPRPDPAPGDGYYYLVRAATLCVEGSWGTDSSGVEREPACR